ncbi:MAG: methionine adenosyltransferase [bacterium]|nr:methionine adenosyltransferase [bacterium]
MFFTSESVTDGHPDKVADQISDAILDAILVEDDHVEDVRVACETMVTTGLVVVAGEIRTKCYVDIPDIVRETVREIGYVGGDMGFDADACAVMTTIDKQSPHISMGVDTGGAGDQGMMFGFATNETPELMPLPLTLAHRMVKRLADLRRAGDLPLARPDGKSQVTIEYDGRKPVNIDTVVISTQHSPDWEIEQLRCDVDEKVIKPILEESGYDFEGYKRHINPTGCFVIGGPVGDCGLTGRKIIVDTYGGRGSHGGGAFSGKDSSKVDRSASYMARYIAKNIVAAELADEVEVQLAYAIGVVDPVSVMVDTFGSGKAADAVITKAVREIFPLQPRQIIKHLDLLRPQFRRTAAFGHFGRETEAFRWEETDLAGELKSRFNL